MNGLDSLDNILVAKWLHASDLFDCIIDSQYINSLWPSDAT